jgi:hypothetical protein
MGRRTSGQTVGLQTIGNVQANANTLTTTQTNQNLTIAPNGTGTVAVQSSTAITGDLSIANQGDLRLLEASGNGTNYIAMQAAATMAANYTITWPAAVSGTSGFVLTSDTSGNLSWASAGGNIPVGDSGSTATVHYPLFGTNAGSLPTTLSPLVRSNLSFVPSTGDLNVPIVSGGSANSATLTIRGTTAATKAAASVLMSDNVASTSTTTGTLVVTGGVGISGNVHVGGSGGIRFASTAGTTTTDLLYQQISDNDFFRIRTGGTTTNAGFVEIATADDGTEPIHVRQYTGEFTTLARTATLLDGSGNTSFPGTVTANILTATSDARLKENVATIDDALNKTLALRGVMFNRIGTVSKELGVIAQEVEAVVPELVITGEDGMKAVAYGNSIGLLIEAIKTLNDKIEDLKGRLA